MSGAVVGYVGRDVPRELIEAAGCTALRLAPLDGIDARFADRVLGPGVDEAARLVLAGLLEDAYPIDRLVLCHDSDHTVRLYTALRRLGRTAWFLDLLHGPRATSGFYSRARLAELADRLGAGDPAGAIRAANRAREAGDRLAALRRAGAVRGTDALALLRAGTTLPADRHAELLEAAAAEPPPAGGRTVVLHGSGHDRDEVYAAIEELGATVIGETHDWGEALLAGRVDEDGDPLDALVRHYGRPPRTEPPVADVSIAWLRRGDRARAWSLPPVDVVLRDRPYRLDDASHAALEEALA
ncbi:MAG TPA: 2-hydroxyacyl-CoA dehydratase family protein [Gaiellaceae bacterium]|nr:2-hydroxyacyl-CoA dehydratase family protein [Gaiellaceae bacterium]